jgi:hypothetical protein
MKVGKVGGECYMNWRDRELHTGFYLENMKGRGHLENLDARRKIILKWLLKK